MPPNTNEKEYYISFKGPTSCDNGFAVHHHNFDIIVLLLTCSAFILQHRCDKKRTWYHLSRGGRGRHDYDQRRHNYYCDMDSFVVGEKRKKGVFVHTQ